MIRPYECTVVFDGTLPDETIAGENQKMEALLSEHATLDKTDVWGKRVLAYSIRKKRTGTIYLYHFHGEGDIAARIERTLKLNQSVLRYLTVIADPQKVITPVPRETPEGNNDSKGDDQ